MGKYKAVLSRNSSYRPDARSRMIGTHMYTANKPTVLSTIQARDIANNRPGGINRDGTLYKNMTQAQRARTYSITYLHTDCGLLGFEGSVRPYPNEAHHILICETFYDKKWTEDHLNIVLQVRYDINNKMNIIYLPQGEKGQDHICLYHQLPNHAKGHFAYNSRVLGETQGIFDLVNKVVLEAKPCSETKDIRAKIKSGLQDIESDNFDMLSGLGPVPLR
jgi:hypothetical protein